MSAALGRPRLHLRRTDSTNERARALASGGAPHGALVTASEQSSGRGRQGRAWLAAPNSSLLMSLVLRDPPALLALASAVAVCDAVSESVGANARVKWPNDVVLAVSRAGRLAAPPSHNADSAAGALAKLAGILVEARPQDGWAVVGIGVNVALRIRDLPSELRPTAASLELPPSQIEPLLGALLGALERRLEQPPQTLLDAWRTLDVLHGRQVTWEHRSTTEGRGGWMTGRAEGVDDEGRLLVSHPDGTVTALSAGEVHLVAKSSVVV
jgi:BirA family transcriptional regulator, biotin operon repressor / biotin---[acetyl-CoA-carboxylase] ligase